MPKTSRPLPLVAQSLDFTCGAACFASMFEHLRGHSPGEMAFAAELGTLEKGFTPPEDLLRLLGAYGFRAEMHEGASLEDLRAAWDAHEVVYVTWWDEDAGHYSLVMELGPDEIQLMDPWTAREGRPNRLALAQFLPNWRQRGARWIGVSR